MNHFSYEQWKKYVKNELDESVREVYDDHLYSCDQCLELYLQAVAEYESELPILSNEEDFTNAIMAQVTVHKEHTNEEKNKKVVPFYQKTIFHYAIAAAMTVLLMTTGVFQSITKYVDSVESPTLEENTPSVTEGIVNKTFAWMDSIDIKNKEANQ